MKCNVCHFELSEPIYIAPTDRAITSLCEERSGRVRVWLCSNCGHLCGEPLPDTHEFYETDYRILLNDEEEDQIYEVQGDKIVYRTDHQVATLLEKLDLPEGARLLDYGCAKASMPKRLLGGRPDLKIHLFDVSNMYIDYWRKFLKEECWAIHEIPKDWCQRFDVVTSFFALEHIPDPVNTVREVAALLADDGVFYGIVPDTFGNVADFVVIDHVNHFTHCSLHYLLSTAGFESISIDSDSHRGALVFSARKRGPVSSRPDLRKSLEASHQLAAYWAGLCTEILAAEQRNIDLPAAIYGSGFYGAYILSLLNETERVSCFLDASPYQQGKILFGRPILPPEQLASEVRLLYIGLNPKIARVAVKNMNWLRERDLALVFLDGDALC